MHKDWSNREHEMTVNTSRNRKRSEHNKHNGKHLKRAAGRGQVKIWTANTASASFLSLLGTLVFRQLTGTGLVLPTHSSLTYTCETATQC